MHKKKLHSKHWNKDNKYSKTHGMKNTKIYTVWCNMKSRCKLRDGGSDIYICYDWECSFESFYKDMGNIPEGRMLDRIDNNKGYYKENCRWVSRKQQNNN